MQNNFFYISIMIIISLVWLNAHSMENQLEKEQQILALHLVAAKKMNPNLVNDSSSFRPSKTEDDTETEEEKDEQKIEPKKVGQYLNKAGCFECPDCKMITKSYSNFKRHLNIQHIGPKLICKDCNRSYKNPDTLNKHQKKKHRKLFLQH